MPHDDGGVDKLKNQLYSRKNEHQSMQDVRAPLTPSEAEAPMSWKGELRPTAPRAIVTPAKGMGFALKFLIASVLFFVLAVAGALFFFFSGGNYISPQNIDLEVVAPTLADGGTTANLQFIITNRNTAELQLADLVIDYPEGTRDAKNPEKALSHERVSIGTIAPGRQVKLTSNVVFYGSEGSIQAVKAQLEYSVQGSNAVFTKNGETSITIGSSPVSVRVAAPQEAIAGQPFTVTVTVQSNGTEPVRDVMVQGQYPFGFSVNSASPRADSGSTVWRLGTMAPGTTQVIKINGTIDGQDGDERVFRFLAGSNKDQTASKIDVPFLSVPTTLTVRRPFISGTIAIGGQTGEKISAAAGKPLQGTITWQNNLSEAVSDVQVKVTLSGPVLDRSSIQPGSGFYQSSDSTITWTSAQDPSLANVPPGGTGTLQFSFGTLPPGSGGVVYTNPTVDVELSVGGVRTGQGDVPEEVTSAAKTQITLASAATLLAEALHFTGPFNNPGPMPPRVETITQYTIRWTVKNSSNAVAGASVSAVLPTYVTFIAAQEGSDLTYDAGSRTVRWNIGDLSAGAGYSTAARQGAFQIAFAPSASQVSYSPTLTGAAAFTGTDRFAQVTVNATAEAPTTKLNETGFAAGMDIVQPKQ